MYFILHKPFSCPELPAAGLFCNYTQRRNYLRMNTTSPILNNLQHAHLLMSLCIN